MKKQEYGQRKTKTLQCSFIQRNKNNQTEGKDKGKLKKENDFSVILNM